MDLVIGGSGFIGAHLVGMLKERGRSVRVFDLAPFPGDEPFKPDEIILGDIEDAPVLEDVVCDCEIVYHLAANPNLWARNAKIFDRTNRQGTANVLSAVGKAAGVKKLIYTSTESILVPKVHGGPVTEDVRATLDDMMGPYCRSKFLAEELVFEEAKKGLPAIVVNPTMPLGPGDRNMTPPGRMIRDFLEGKIRGYMDCTLNFVDVRDAALGHILAAEYAEVGKRHILAGHNLHLRDFFGMLARHCDTKAPTFQVPYGLALNFSRLEEAWGKLSGRRPMSSITGVKLCKRGMAFDSSATWKRLGDHKPLPIEQTIAEAVAWHAARL
jgi:dihydroflavonol-4-reductase